jgi:hypothetical protein
MLYALHNAMEIMQPKLLPFAILAHRNFTSTLGNSNENTGAEKQFSIMFAGAMYLYLYLLPLLLSYLNSGVMHQMRCYDADEN